MSERGLARRNIIVAAVLAVAAALLTLLYVSRAKGGTPAARAVKTATAYVAKSDLPVGTPASAAFANGSIVARAVPVEEMQPDAVTAKGALLGLVVTQPIYAGDVLTLKRFGRSGTEGLRSTLRGTLRVIAVPGDPQQLLAGTVQVGDHVDVIANLKDGQGVAHTKVFLRNILVVSAPAASNGSGASDSSQQDTALVELTDLEAQRLFFAMKNGDWAFVLRPSVKPRSGTFRGSNEPTIVGPAPYGYSEVK